MVYLYHIRLLLHFTRLRTLNISHFLHKSIGNMADKIQGNPKQFESNLFHCALIKLLIVKELKKRKRTWESFLEKMGYHPILPGTPKDKKVSPSKNR